MHLLAWRRAVDETARVARSGCIFHRTPLRNRGATALMTKKAYGSDVVEICFSEDDLLAAFSAARLSVIRSILVEELSLPLDGGARMVTHVCKKI